MKKKHLRCLLVLLVAVCMVCSIAVPVCAEVLPSAQIGTPETALESDTEKDNTPTPTPTDTPTPEPAPSEAPSTPETSEPAATSETAAPAAPSLDEITTMLYSDLPDAPTGYYVGEYGLPVGTGQTKISLSAWQDELLDESSQGRLDADALNTDTSAMAVAKQPGQDYAIVPIVMQVEYPANGSATTVTLGTFLTEDTSLVGETVAVMDKAREAYVEEQMDLYRQRVDRNGKPYRNVVLQWENGFSNNDKEILTIVSCYYEQDWEIDMADLASWAVLKSISFSTRERGPYSCGGCRSRKVCDGHPDGNGGTYHHSDDAADCDNYHTVTYCPGDHYDLYVTATLPGCQTWNDEAGATEQTIARWDDLVDLSYTGSSAVMQQYQQAVRMATLNEDWEGWTELNIEWSKVLFQTDWEELYGVTVTQVGITDSGSYTPDDSFTGNLPGSGNGTFILPLASYSYISCHFGEADGWTGAPHGGMDFAAGYGTPIYAAADGVVVKAGWHNSWGNYVKIYHGTDAQGNKIYTLYAHASSLAATAGQTVTQGQTIAYVGSTGDSTGNHLHFEVYVNNTRVDPEGWL